MYVASKGFWTELLGWGDFYYELGVQVIEACMSSRETDGGLTEWNELKKRVQKRRGAKQAKLSE